VSLIERLRQRGWSTDVRSVFVAPVLAALAERLRTATTVEFEVPANLIPENFGDAADAKDIEEFNV